jgi:hypothetical protein
MYLDGYPELAYARLIRTRARGVPIRDSGRACAIAWMADGSLLPADTIVRFDVAEGEKAPRRLAEINNEAVGVGITDEVDKHWIELRVAVFPAFRGRGYGAAIAGTLADELEAKEGRLVCAGIHQMDERSRLTMERGGFRLVDYYFLAERKLR